MNRLSNGESRELGEALRMAADAVWNEVSDNVWQVPLSLGHRSFLELDSVALLSEDHQKYNLKNIFFLAETRKTKAHVFQCSRGQQFVIREGVRENSTRSIAPCVLQPYRCYTSRQSYRRLEVLPYVAMAESGGIVDETKPVIQSVSFFFPQEDVANAQKHMLREIWKVSANKTCLRRDIGLMPNGTPLQVDPEAVDGTAGVMLDYKQALSDTWDFQNDMNLPSEMHYVDRNGKTIQEKIFPNPF